MWKTGGDFRTVGELSVYALRTVEPLVIPRFVTVDAAVAEDPGMKAAVALDPAASYVVATNDYAAGGGDGFEVFVDAPRIIDASGGRLLASIVMDYIGRNAPVAPQVEGRILIE